MESTCAKWFAAMAVTVAVSTVIVAGCTTATPLSDAEYRERAVALMKTSFKANGQAQLDRLEQDEAARLCTDASAAKQPIAKPAAERIERANLAAVRWPVDGKFVGDWRGGERVAQSGVGKQFNDAADIAAGGNCYACHQITREEISFGTIGPSLHNFGKIRAGMKREELERYTYGKIFNSQAYSACSNMPRFGANQVLTEAQIKDLVALLIDPASPVNK